MKLLVKVFGQRFAVFVSLVVASTVLVGCQMQLPPAVGTCRTNHALRVNPVTCSLTAVQLSALAGIPVPATASGFEAVYESYGPDVDARFQVPLTEIDTFSTLTNYRGLVVDGGPIISTDTSGSLRRSLLVESRGSELSVFIVLTAQAANVQNGVNGQVGNCNNQDLRAGPCSPTPQEVTAESGVPIPATATAFSSTYEGFTDWIITATFTVPISELTRYVSLPNFPGVAVGGPEVKGINDSPIGPFRSLQLRLVNGRLEALVVVFTT